MHKLHPQFHVIPLQCPTCNYGNTLKPEACSTQPALAKTPYTCTQILASARSIEQISGLTSLGHIGLTLLHVFDVLELQ